ncbi:MAG: YkgJ family cysteine cluster protein [Bryobacteraceae bacterium]|nr:YkgJ family cysteine cluster protein [Bryobacteraceae bacterium]
MIRVRMTPLESQYASLAAAVDEEFARGRRLHGARIQCGPGCYECCHQLFQITELEAARISDAVAHLPECAALVERAARYVEERARLVTAKGEQEAWGSLPPPGTRLLCPALEDGLCRIYDARPLICRKFGVPLYNPTKPGRVFACEKNFSDGDAIEDDALIQIQTGLHQRGAALQAAYNDGGGKRDARPITVARAILEDFRPYLPR